MNLQEVRQLLSEANTPWFNRNQNIDWSGLEARRRSLGVPDSDISAALQAASGRLTPPYSSRKVAPSSVDWRNRNGNWTGAAREQGICNSCTAFAFCGAMEARWRIQSDNASDPVNLSPGDLFFCGHTGGCAVGMHIHEAIARAEISGVPLETSAPYNIAASSCRNAPAHLKIASFAYCAGDARSRKLALSEEGPVVGVMRVFEDFLLYRQGVYRHSAGDDQGLHAIAVVGYDDQEACWICKNSWGADFGDTGYFKIGYGECELDARPFVSLYVERA